MKKKVREEFSRIHEELWDVQNRVCLLIEERGEIQAKANDAIKSLNPLIAKQETIENMRRELASMNIKVEQWRMEHDKIRNRVFEIERRFDQFGELLSHAVRPMEPLTKKRIPVDGCIEIQFEPGAAEQLFKGCRVSSPDDPMEKMKREHLEMKLKEAEEAVEQKMRGIVRDEFDDLLYQHNLTRVEEE